MKIADLDPRWKSGILVINCPCGKCGGRLRIPTTEAQKDPREPHKIYWEVSGEFPNLTLSPSVNAGCWHGFITNGEATFC